MISVAISSTAALLQTATEKLGASTRWPDPASALAYRMLVASGFPAPVFASFPVAMPASSMLRMTPEIATYGYLLDQMGMESRSDWCNAVEHLRGREIYPPDRSEEHTSELQSH